MIGFLNNLNYLEVVFQNCCYCEDFLFDKIWSFSCIGKMICLVHCTFVVYFGCLALFVAFVTAVSVSSTIVTPFFEG